MASSKSAAADILYGACIALDDTDKRKMYLSKIANKKHKSAICCTSCVIGFMELDRTWDGYDALVHSFVLRIHVLLAILRFSVLSTGSSHATN